MSDNTTQTAAQTDNQPRFDARSIEVSLTVTDIERSVDWYTGVIGFDVDQRHEREGKVIGVSLRGGDVRILLMQDNGEKGFDRVKGEGFSIQFVTDNDVDDLVEQIRASEGTVLSEPQDMPWGVRAFRAADPEGFRLTFSKKLSS